jgi:hypothetical protein
MDIHAWQVCADEPSCRIVSERRLSNSYRRGSMQSGNKIDLWTLLQHVAATHDRNNLYHLTCLYEYYNGASVRILYDVYSPRLQAYIDKLREVAHVVLGIELVVTVYVRYVPPAATEPPKEPKLVEGQTGTVVHVYEDGSTCEMEFPSDTDTSVLTMHWKDKEPIQIVDSSKEPNIEHITLGPDLLGPPPPKPLFACRYPGCAFRSSHRTLMQQHQETCLHKTTNG